MIGSRRQSTNPLNTSLVFWMIDLGRIPTEHECFE